ncbi:MAG: hypothetical protein JST14_09380 [Bacteroidetes bacterium]|nr:hypothetical protein [Bacteroidota bacterium]MBS1977392.1 hypothetical protein [Bacteroidota bacterium]
MKITRLIGGTLILIWMLPVTGLFAQKLAIESTYTITKQAKKGYLDEVKYDPATKVTMLSFVTRAKSNNKRSKVNYQNYFFDQDYKFIKVEEETEVDYRNKLYQKHGDEYSVEGISIQNNLVGTFVIKKKLITYTWDWFFGGYNKKKKLLEKIKPKDEMGNKYTLVRRWENDETGEVLAMVGGKGKNATPNEYSFMMIDKSLNMKLTDVAKFDDPKTIVYSGYMPMAADDDNSGDEEEGEEEEEGGEAEDDDGNLSNSDIAILFAASSLGKKADADEHSYIFWRINNNGVITEKIPLQTKASVWDVRQVIYTENSIFLMGPANEGKYYDQVMSKSNVENKKWKLFQMAKITNQKIEYLTTTNLDEFDAKLKTPPSQKKTPSYDGKRIRLAFAKLLPDGAVVIAGQNYEWVTQNKVRRRSYRDPIMFHFDNQGVLLSQYGVRREENQKSATYAPTGMWGSIGKGCFYWTIYEMNGFADEKEGDRKITRALLYPSVARIDAKSGEIGDFVQFGLVKDKPTYYLHRRHGILPIKEDNAIVYLGTDKPGKVLWFGKVVLE